MGDPDSIDLNATFNGSNTKWNVIALFPTDRAWGPLKSLFLLCGPSLGQSGVLPKPPVCISELDYAGDDYKNLCIVNQGLH